MTTLVGIINVLIFILLGGIHIYWGLGGKWGSRQALPQHLHDGAPLFVPGVVACFSVALGLLAMAVVTFSKIGFIQIILPDVIDEYGLWIIGSIFLLRAIGDFKYVGFFKSIRDTEFGHLDKLFYSPLCLYLGLTSFLITFLN